MSGKIINLDPGQLSWETLLHQILEREGVEAVVMAVRIDDRWHTTWSNETHGGLCMAAMKLQADVLDWIHR